MFSTLSSYIWASEPEDQTVPDDKVEMREQEENEWVLIDVVDTQTPNKSGEINTVSGGKHDLGRVDSRCPAVLEESWYITPPSCFNASQDDSLTLEMSPLEDLLIEHPSMSVYGPPESGWEDFAADPEQTPENSQSDLGRAVERRSHAHRRVLRVVDKVELLTRRVQKNVVQQAKKKLGKKKLERTNKTKQRIPHSRHKQKQIDRKQGKHSGVYSNRGC